MFDKAQTEELLKQVKNNASISEIIYSDGSTIASIEGDLLRTSVGSRCYLDNLKRAIIATEGMVNTGLYLKHDIATLGTFVE